jgi:hypothetical protein
VSVTHFYTADDSEAIAAMTNMLATSEGDPFWVFAKSSADVVPMYRSRHIATGSHLFTTFIDERDAAVNEEGYEGEGIAFWCLPESATTQPDTQPLFRLYNAQTADHFYTIDSHETGGYRREGVACLVFSTQILNSVPLHRLRSPEGRHFYTADAAEQQTLLGQKYIDEGKCGFVFLTATVGPQPLFRSYNPSTGGHLYTLNILEHDSASKNSGYRGDGISCYLWPDGAQPPAATKLYRVYNAKLDDHLYTIDEVEYRRALLESDYTDEGVAGWVLPPDVGPLNPMATPMHRLLGDFGNDFLLLPSNLPTFLSSGSNYFLTSEIGGRVDPIMGLDVQLTITNDLTLSSVNVGDLGCSFQLNAYAPQLFNSAWQQYAIWFKGDELNCEIQNWSQSPYSAGFVVGGRSLCNIGRDTLAAGLRLRIALMNDEYGNILGADFYVYKGNDELAHRNLTIADFKNPHTTGATFGAAPIIAVQQVLVGPYDAERVTFATGGAGCITYRAAVPIRATTQLPSVTGWPGAATGEESNALYGEIAATKSKVLTQGLRVGGIQPSPLRRPGVSLIKRIRPKADRSFVHQ